MLTGKVCVVNGAASAIGQAVAERFASEGAVVVGVDKVEHSVGEQAMRADLADESQVQAMYDRVVREHGRLDVIYNNMGLMDAGDHSALDTSLETWRRVHDANLTSIFLSCKYGIAHLRDTEPTGGSVINAASFLAAVGSATAPMAYAAAKAGVVQLTRDLGVHLARSGIRVNAVLFGPIATPAQQAVFDRNPGALEQAAGALADGAVRHAGGGGRHDRLPCQRGLRLHHRRRAATRRRHHRGIHRPGMTAGSAGGRGGRSAAELYGTSTILPRVCRFIRSRYAARTSANG